MVSNEMRGTLIRKHTELFIAMVLFDDPEGRVKQMIFRQICLLKEKREEGKIYMEERYQLSIRV